MLLPKKRKFRKDHRGHRRGVSKGQTQVHFGEYGIKSLENGWITNRQIEAARIAMTRKIKRGGKVWINVFPDKSVTAKPAETRLGSGKGSPEHWVAVDQVSVQMDPNNNFDKPHVAVSGVLQGASTATARTYASASGFGRHETLARCEKLALLALARPGRFALLVVRNDQGQSDGTYLIKACRLQRVN